MSQRLLRPGDEIRRVRYFTALASGDPCASREGQTGDGSDTPTRQQIYLRALRTLPELRVHLGQFFVHATPMMRADCAGHELVFKREEKGSDVNLGAYLVLDAARDAFDTALVISNDTDLMTPIELVRREFGKTVGVSCPVYPRDRNPSQSLVAATDFNVHLRRKERRFLRDSQFPPTLRDAHGEFHKPPSW